MHRLIVYAPIVLALVALGYDAWAVFAGNPHYHAAGSRMLKWAALAALAAVGTGFSLAGGSGLGSGGGVTGHAGSGLLAVIALFAVVFARYSAENREEPGDVPSPLLLGLEASAVLLILVTAAIGFGL